MRQGELRNILSITMFVLFLGAGLMTLSDITTLAATQAAEPRATGRDPARLAIAEAAMLRAEWRAASFQKAIGKYEEALLLLRDSRDSLDEARVLAYLGEVFCIVSDYQKALGIYHDSLRIYRSLNDRRGEAEALNGISYAYLCLGENRKALNYGRQALALNARGRDRRIEAEALNNIGEAHYFMGDLEQALALLERALSLTQNENEGRGQTRALSAIASVHIDQGETEKAFALLNRALSLCRAINDRRSEAYTLQLLGSQMAFLGDYQQALNLANQGLQVFQRIGDRSGEAIAISRMGYIHLNLGETKKTLGFYNQAADIYKELGNRYYEGTMLANIGDVLRLLGDHRTALVKYGDALALIRLAGDKQWEALTLNSIGAAHLDMGDRQKALDAYVRALPLFRETGNQRWEAETHNGIGLIHLKSGDRRRAFASFGQALRLSRAVGDPVGESNAFHNIALAERNGGNLDKARARVDESLKIIESLRTNVSSHDLRASYFASVRQQHEFYVDLLMRLHRERPSEGFDAAAFEASERARARSLLETLAAARVGDRRRADPALLEREGSLRKELNERAERRMRLPAGGGQALAEAAALGKEIDELTSQLREVEAQIRAGSMEHTASLETQPLGLKAIQERVVDDDTLLLEYSLGEERSYLWAVTKTEALSYELPGRAEIEGATQRVRGLLIAPQPVEGETFAMRQERMKEAEGRYWQEASALGEMLLGQVAERLGEKRLLVVADGALQYIPFGALPVPRRGEGEPVPLMIEHEITSQPSASTLAALRGDAGQRRSGPRGVAVFADPVFERDDARLTGAGGVLVAEAQVETREGDAHRALRDVGVTGGGNIPRLFASREEAKAIRDVMPAGTGFEAMGFAANRDTASSPELAKYRIIHFATHGALDSERPELSGLVLSLFDEHGRPREGFLRLNDIYNLDLPAELVVLSACNTGLGKDVKGEGLIGLTRGFMHAGTARVLASLWKVDDEATAELMKTFYGEMLREKKSPAAALRAAQSAMWRQKRWRAPYFWAAFVLQGEYSGKIEVGEDAPLVSYRQMGAAGAAALALVLGGGYLLRRKRRNRSAHVH